MASLWLGLGTVAAAGLAAWLTYEHTRSPTVPVAPAPTADLGAAALPRLDTETPALASLRTTLERPLFDDDRRPDPPADTNGAKPEQPEAAKLLPARLTAVVVSGDGQRSVLLEVTGQDQPQLVRKGDLVGGWRVEEIEDEAVVLNAGGQRSVVPLRVFGEPAPKRTAVRPATQRRAADAGRRTPPPKPAAQDGNVPAPAPAADTNPAAPPPTQPARGAAAQGTNRAAPKKQD
jgi:hypothetical protein